MTLTTYKIIIPAAPYPFEGKAEATTLHAAIDKVKWQAERCGVKVVKNSNTRNGVEYEELSRREV